ncbi:MAG: membrane protein insertase YidC [Bacteroidales bacterium]|nr:membrane protein insertase YidC [Bacteroidales bacterium]
MNFFETIVSPFVWLIEVILHFAYEITGNYGLAVIILSFVISALTLPIFIFIEKSKKKDDSIKKKMQPLIDEIKRVYKGQERYYYIKTINRQHNYNSAKALIPILSLLIQIPFFIAAYQYLEHFEPLKGVSFLFIKDLSLPDGVFGSINILPILMTLVNILTAYFYTINGNKTELKQMLGIAGLFLVLLFNLPSGLVLYWTMNNVFSFLRLFVTNPDVFTHNSIIKLQYFYRGFLNSFKQNYILAFIISMGLILSIILHNINFDNSLLYKFINFVETAFIYLLVTLLSIFSFNNFLQILYNNEKNLIRFQITVIFISLYFLFAATFYFRGDNSLLYYSAIYFLTSLQILNLFYKFLKSKMIIKILVVSLIALQIILLSFFLLKLQLEFSILNIKVTITNVDCLSQFLLIGLLTNLLLIPLKITHTTIGNKEKSILKKSYILYSLIWLYILGFVFLWNPLTVFSTFPENYTFSGIDILLKNSFLFLISFCITIILYFFSPRKISKWLMNLSVTIALLSFLYNTILPIDLGTLQESRFLFQDRLSMPILYYFLEIFLIIIIWYFVKRFIVRIKTIWLTYSFLLLNIVLISNSLYYSNSSNCFIKKANLEKEIKNSITFSKTQPNVVFFVADMFDGPHLEEILKDEPQLNSIFSGFTYYNNAISVSSITLASMPAILGGLDYTIDKLNKDTVHDMTEKMTHISELFYKKVKNKGYNFISSDIAFSYIDKNKFDSYLPKWSDKWNKWNTQLKIGDIREDGYSLLWKNALFYSIPLFLKPFLYDSGNWLIEQKTFNENSNSAQRYNFLRLLPKISSNTSNKPNFIYIHSLATHHPWQLVDDNGILSSKVEPYENNKWFIKTIGRWINWMKENDVYDNTRIILISDHGIHWQHVDGKSKPNLPLKNQDLLLEQNDYYLFNAMYPLFFVKDFQENGNIKYNSTLISNVDATGFCFSTKCSNYLYKLPKDRKIEITTVPWVSNILSAKKLNIIKHFQVKTSCYDLKDWKIINEK